MEIMINKTLSTIDDIHQLLNETMKVVDQLNSGAAVTLNMRRLRYITPIGFTGLLSVLDYLEDQFEVGIIAPFNINPIKYMERMNFFKVCSKNVKEQFEEQKDMEALYNRHRNSLEDKLLEIRVAKTHPQIVEISTLIKRIFKNKGLKGNRISDIQSFITELGNNVIDHTNSSCFISVKNNEDENEIEIAVADRGEGIYNSLKDVLSENSPHDIVKAAITTKASRLSDEDRGKGLMDIKQRAFRWSEASVALRTNNAVYEITKDGVNPTLEGKTSFGTFFFIKVNYSIDRL
ncbi:ATP-binding protein [Margalitia sp. FSL K6-0131]|uniref:ATP-binding protein n=1 Tax=Margalitia sp. FSL K6-0131 TaxID=2954604 RepID=UPI0030FC19B5